MKVIIAGSRAITDFDLVRRAMLESGFPAREIVSGAAPGVDGLGERFARDAELALSRFPAEWKTYGKRAGRLRNAQMAAYADALVAVWDGKSPGTRHMIETMRALGKPVHVLVV